MLAWRNDPGTGVQPGFPPNIVAKVKALACELPAVRKLPLSRLSIADTRQEALREGIVASIGAATIWRWLSQDAVRPWFHRTWIFPRDPSFPEKAARVLDLYEKVWEGTPLRPDEFVVSADEKTSIQARRRLHSSLPVQPGKPMRVEHEYERSGALAYFAAWDVHRARVYGRCEPTTGIAAFDRLVYQVMAQEPYRSAHRVFWIVDNGSSHRGKRSIERLTRRWPNIILVHTPVHASWLNQVEIYFSVVQRKVLTPNDFADLAEVEARLLAFQDRYERAAQPFQWRFTRQDLDRLLLRLRRPDGPIRRAA